MGHHEPEAFAAEPVHYWPTVTLTGAGAACGAGVIPKIEPKISSVTTTAPAILCEAGNVQNVLRETGLDGVLPVVDPSGTVPA